MISHLNKLPSERNNMIGIIIKYFTGAGRSERAGAGAGAEQSGSGLDRAGAGQEEERRREREQEQELELEQRSWRINTFILIRRWRIC